MSELVVERLSIDDLLELPGNARVHPSDQIDALLYADREKYSRAWLPVGWRRHVDARRA